MLFSIIVISTFLRLEICNANLADGRDHEGYLSNGLFGNENKNVKSEKYRYFESSNKNDINIEGIVLLKNR